MKCLRQPLFRLSALALVATATSSCTAKQGGVAPVLGTLAGGALGYALADEDKELETAALGAAGGYAAGRLIGNRTENEAIYSEAYSRGKADAVKLLYWAERDSHRPDDEDTDIQYRYYEVPVPEHVTSDGVRVASHRRIVEIVE